MVKRGILFSHDSVHEIIQGRKTQTFCPINKLSSDSFFRVGEVLFIYKKVSDNYCIETDINIQINSIRLSLIQDFSREDCLAEGIRDEGREDGEVFFDFINRVERVEGKGVWEKNQIVVVYGFSLVGN